MEENKDKKNTKEELKENVKVGNKDKSNRISKKQLWLISGGGVLLLIIIFALFTTIYLDDGSKKNLGDVNENGASDFKAKYGGFNFKCTSNSPKDEVTILPTSSNGYTVGEDIYCNFDIDDYYSVFKMSFKYNENDNIKLINVESLDNGWNVDNSSNNIFLERTNPSSKINDVILKFNIASNKSVADNYKIKISDIKFNTNYIDDDKETLLRVNKNPSNYKLKITKTNIESYKLQSDGSYIKINDFSCESCNTYGPLVFSYKDFNNGKVMLADHENRSILYSMEKGVLGTYRSARWLNNKDSMFNTDSGKYIFVWSEDTKKAGIIDTDGNIIKSFHIEDTPNYCSSNYVRCLEYSIENNLFVDKKNGKCGIIKLLSDDIVIDYKYDNIEIYDGPYFKVKEEGKWYLIDQSDKKVLSYGHDFIAAFDFGILVMDEVENNKYNTKIIDYTGKDLTNTIEVIDNYSMDGRYEYETSDNEIILSAGVDVHKFKYDLKKKSIEHEKNS